MEISWKKISKTDYFPFDIPIRYASAYESTRPPLDTIDHQRLIAEVEATVFPLLDAGWTPDEVSDIFISNVLDEVISRRV